MQKVDWDQLTLSLEMMLKLTDFFRWQIYVFTAVSLHNSNPEAGDVAAEACFRSLLID